MSLELEEQLRQQLNAEVCGVHLTAWEMERIASGGRARIYRRRAATGVTSVALVVGIGVFAAGWDRGTQDINSADAVVATPSRQSPSTGVFAPPPQMITRSAEEGEFGAYAHLTGTLTVTEDDCIAVTTSDGHLLGVVWGNGWSARRDDGAVAVYDAQGNLFALEGSQVGLGGATAPSRYPGNPCATDTMWEANDAQVARSTG